MGDRYHFDVTCPSCHQTPKGYDFTGYNAYYAPTCGFTDWKCPLCGKIVDLGEYTKISYEDASNRVEIEELVKELTPEPDDG